MPRSPPQPVCPQNHLELGVAANRCNLSAWEAKAGESEVQVRLWLLRDFKAGLHYVRPSDNGSLIQSVY